MHDGFHPRDILWCLTVPAIWSDASKDAMAQAAQLAGNVVFNAFMHVCLKQCLYLFKGKNLRFIMYAFMMYVCRYVNTSTDACMVAW